LLKPETQIDVISNKIKEIEDWVWYRTSGTMEIFT
jgi:hypothetical protein